MTGPASLRLPVAAGVRTLVAGLATGEAVRGRKPTCVYIDSRRRAIVAADIRASETFLRLTVLVGKPLGNVPKTLTPAL